MKLKPLTVEVWRDGEKAQTLNCSLMQVHADSDGAVRLVVPVGTYVELTSEDEIRFDLDELATLMRCQLNR